MICVSLQLETVGEFLEAVEKFPFAELRLENLQPSDEEVARLFSLKKKLIATMRPGPYSESERRRILMAAVNAGASFVDIELESDPEFRKDIVRLARKKGSEIIVSYHNHELTPPAGELQKILSRCFESGADIAKIACHAHSLRDSARILGLLDSPGSVVAIGMGPAGRITRIMAPLLGSPFTYASAEAGRETADGQLDFEKLAMLLRELGKRND